MTWKHTIRTVVVDDEAPARERLLELLEKTEQVEVVGTYSDGVAAIEHLLTDAPDLLFLDVQMPEVSGFDVLEAIDAPHRPVTIFVTAYDKYALRAFDAHALDYLLKPFSDERFERALRRALHQVQQQQHALHHSLEALLQAYYQNPQGPAAGYLDRLVIKTGGRVFFLKVEEIAWIEASGVYVTLHTVGRKHLYREQIGRLEARLDPSCFTRIHRSTLVNIDHIQELLPNSHGEYTVVLHDQTQLRLSRTYRSRLQDRLGQGL